MSSRPLSVYYKMRNDQTPKLPENLPIDDDFIVSRLLHICGERSSRDLTGGSARSPLSSGICGACTAGEVRCC